MYIRRESTDILLNLAEVFPVVCITGPRQSGKSTLVKQVFPHKPYFSLENHINREKAETDPIDFLHKYPDGIIIDEIKRVPELFSHIMVIVDEKKMMGQFILTGSNQFEYMENITQSLAGRIGIVKLLPFSYQELYLNTQTDIDEVMVKGMYPSIFDRNMEVDQFYPAYVNTYLERDVRQIKNILDLTVFRTFLKLCAGRTGRILNMNSLANELGVAQTTIKKWLTILQASFLIFLMPPYFKNVKKRFIRSPKLYFFDTGLVCHLLGIHTVEHLQNHPLRGEIFETFIISEFIKYHYHKGQQTNYHFYRDNNMNEVDLIIETGYGAVPVEIKSGKTINDSFFKGLNFFRKLSDRHKYGGLIYAGDQELRLKKTIIQNYAHIYDIYEELIEKDNWKIERR